MKLIFDNSGKVKNQESVSEKEITDMIEKLHPSDFPYLILEDTESNYIQCMAGDKDFVVEIRIYDENDSFKHFVIGSKETSQVWYSINGAVGPVMVLGHELLRIRDVKNLFVSFFLNNDVPESYAKRNVTKMFR